MRNLILLVAVLLPCVVMAQETAHETTERREDGWVIVKDGNGKRIRGYFSPTPQMALEAIREGKGTTAAEMVLKQKVEMRSGAELDAFADDLARLVLESSSGTVARNALRLLTSATKSYSDREIPYERGLEVLIDLYETMDGTEAVSPYRVWIAIFSAGGEDYLTNLFESLERPEKPCWLPPYAVPIVDGEKLGPPVPPKEEWCPYRTQWCELGKYLATKEVVSSALVYPICDKHLANMFGITTSQ